MSATIDLYGPESVGFEQRLNTEAGRLFRQAVRDHTVSPSIEVPSRSELLAQAFVNLVERGATAAAFACVGPPAPMLPSCGALENTPASCLLNCASPSRAESLSAISCAAALPYVWGQVYPLDTKARVKSVRCSQRAGESVTTPWA